jgi:hypothetical protein
MIGFGSQAFTSCVICAHVIRSFLASTPQRMPVPTANPKWLTGSRESADTRS